MRVVLCPICNRELVPWLVPLNEAPFLLGVPLVELEEQIEMGEIVVRVNLSNSPPTEVIDMRTVRNLPPGVHKTMKHLKPRGRTKETERKSHDQQSGSA